MAYILFLDESGQDRKDSPYEVLAGVAIEDRDLWSLTRSIQDAEIKHFGQRYSLDRSELKGSKLLKRKTFRQARQMQAIPDERRRLCASRCLTYGATATREQITALAQAKLAYVTEVFDVCQRFRVKAFASITSQDADRPSSPLFLRKDYAYLFERFYYFLDDLRPSPMGLVVFDELERSQSHLLLTQMDHYFKRTQNGQTRSSLIIPEPLFVHSDLTTGVQVADLVAYVISWGFRIARMSMPAREELATYADQVAAMRHRAVRSVGDRDDFVVWSFAYLEDLTTSST
ncbi:MAG: DUF3800 domain-containing protein [Bacteroidota bacterium]